MQLQPLATNSFEFLPVPFLLSTVSRRDNILRRQQLRVLHRFFSIFTSKKLGLLSYDENEELDLLVFVIFLYFLLFFLILLFFS